MRSRVTRWALGSQMAPPPRTTPPTTAIQASSARQRRSTNRRAAEVRGARFVCSCFILVQFRDQRISHAYVESGARTQQPHCAVILPCGIREALRGPISLHRSHRELLAAVLLKGGNSLFSRKRPLLPMVNSTMQRAVAGFDGSDTSHAFRCDREGEFGAHDQDSAAGA